MAICQASTDEARARSNPDPLALDYGRSPLNRPKEGERLPDA
jgi:hypothetical protein